MAQRGRPRKYPEKTLDEQTESLVKKSNSERTALAESTFGQEFVEKGDNSKFLAHAMRHHSLAPIDLNDNKQVEDRINLYFTQCIEDDIKPSVTGLANSIGVDRRTLWQWKAGVKRAGDPARKEIVLRAYSILEELWEDYMLNGKVNPVSGIFLGKNLFGYTDKQEIVVAPKDPLGEQENVENIRNKYLESAVIDDED